MMKKTNRYIKELCTLMVLMSAMYMVCSCKTIKNTRKQSSGQKNTLVINDSVHITESVFVDRFRRGDTLFVCKDRYRLETHSKVKLDSFVQKDSVYSDIVKEVKEPKENKSSTPWWRKYIIEAIVIVVALWLIRIGFNSLIKRW